MQWPAAAALDAALVTALVGANDALHTGRAQWTRDVRDLCAALPPKAVGYLQWADALSEALGLEQGRHLAE